MLNCTCPIADCPAQPTGAFIRNIVSSPEVISKVHPVPTDPEGRLAFWRSEPSEPPGGSGFPIIHGGHACFCPQYEKALLRGYVESCSNLTWCTNPQGCDRILCRQGLGSGTTCSKCGWASCFSCSFPEVGAHSPPAQRLSSHTPM